MPSPLEQLQTQIQQCPFTDLEAHIARGALIILDSSLDLAQTTLLVVDDETAKISDLIERELIKKPSQEFIEKFSADKSSVRFEFLIAQPFVLAKLVLN